MPFPEQAELWKKPPRAAKRRIPLMNNTGFHIVRFMKNVHVLARVFAVFSLVAPVVIAAPLDRLSPAERAFCEVHMERALELYRAGEQEAALESLDASYHLADEKFRDSFFVHRIIWWEAQVDSGKEDEEWGLKLFRYLRDREHRLHPEHAIKIPGRDFVLYGNIIEKLENLGMLAEARAETRPLEFTLSEDLGFDLTCESYSDNGPLFEFLPEVRARAYPIMRNDNPEYGANASGCSTFVYYCYMYGLQYSSNAALDAGDWKRAAELADWFLQYNDAFALSQERMRGEVCRHALYATDTLADICLIHGYPADAAEWYETFLGKMDSGQYTASTNVYFKARLNLARIQIQQGTLPPDAARMARTAVEGIEAWEHFDRLEIIHAKLSEARVLHALGRPREAWAIVNGLFEETAFDVNTYHQLRILTTAIDLALNEGGTHPELEQWLLIALDNERRMGNKFGELPLYEKYARFLRLQGRFDEAEAILRESVRLAKAMNIPRGVERAQLALDELRGQPVEPRLADAPAAPAPSDAAVEQRVPATEPEVRHGETAAAGIRVAARIPVDIQPILSLSAALPGRSAHGRFYLTNPGATPRTGALLIVGRVETPNWRNDQWLTMQASPAFKHVVLSRPLLLSPGESRVIDITGMPASDGAGGTVSCSWMEDGAVIAEGQWEYRAGGTENRTAVIDAHETRDNPFYLVPINHTVQRRDTESAEVVDLTVVASAPMRIEAYDGATGRLLYVDANGDGDFKDAGDVIASDSNNNNWPDVIFGAGDPMAMLTLYVKAIQLDDLEKELTIKLREEGEWRVDAVDVIK